MRRHHLFGSEITMNKKEHKIQNLYSKEIGLDLTKIVFKLKSSMYCKVISIYCRNLMSFLTVLCLKNKHRHTHV